MINIDEINEAIQNFEKKRSTTYDNCMKLAALYIVRDHYSYDMYDQESCQMDKRQNQNWLHGT